MPFDLANPVWVDDDDLDIDHHIRHVILPRPGSFERLEQLVGRLHSPLMDRSRPLWEIYIIEGLKTGQVALYSKMHHAGIDGQAGVALAKVLYSDTRRAGPGEAAARPRARQPASFGVAELAGVGAAQCGAADRRLAEVAAARPRSAARHARAGVRRRRQAPPGQAERACTRAATRR